VFTHLHPDHVGWNLVRDEDGTPRPPASLSRATSSRRPNGATTAPCKTHPNIRLQALPLAGLGVVDLYAGDHAVAPSLATVATPGHTPGHQSLVLTSGGERLCILGDLAHTEANAHETEWVQRFDWDPEAARATRRTVLGRLEATGELVAAGHLPHPGIGRFGRVNGRRTWRPI